MSETCLSSEAVLPLSDLFVPRKVLVPESARCFLAPSPHLTMCFNFKLSGNEVYYTFFLITSKEHAV